MEKKRKDGERKKGQEGDREKTRAWESLIRELGAGTMSHSLNSVKSCHTTEHLVVSNSRLTVQQPDNTTLNDPLKNIVKGLHTKIKCKKQNELPVLYFLITLGFPCISYFLIFLLISQFST